MKKFPGLVAMATLIICFFSIHSLAQPSTSNGGSDIDFNTVEKLSKKFTKKFKNGILKKNPQGYMVKFSRKELMALLESVPNTDSINLVLGSFSKNEKDSLRKKPMVIFQFKTAPSEKNVNGEYIYKVQGKLCPLPYSGCKVIPVPQN